jgi:CHAT domain-containing protein
MAQQWLRDVTNEKLERYLKEHITLPPELQDINEREQHKLPWRFLESELRLLRQYRRMGREKETPYSHPYHWAGFAFFGAME